MVADILVAQRDLQIFILPPDCFGTGLLHPVETPLRDDGQYMAADQVGIQEVGGIAGRSIAGGIGQGVPAGNGNADSGAMDAAGSGRAIAHIRIQAAELAARIEPPLRMVIVQVDRHLLQRVPADIDAGIVVLQHRTVDLGLEIGRRVGLHEAGDGAAGVLHDVGQASSIEPDTEAILPGMQRVARKIFVQRHLEFVMRPPLQHRPAVDARVGRDFLIDAIILDEPGIGGQRGRGPRRRARHLGVGDARALPALDVHMVAAGAADRIGAIDQDAEMVASERVADQRLDRGGEVALFRRDGGGG